MHAPPAAHQPPVPSGAAAVPPGLMAELAELDRRRIHDQQQHTKSLDASRAELVRLRRSLEESEAKRQRLAQELARERASAAAATRAAQSAQDAALATQRADLRREFDAASQQWSQWKDAQLEQQAAMQHYIAQQQTQVRSMEDHQARRRGLLCAPRCAGQPCLSSRFQLAHVTEDNQHLRKQNTQLAAQAEQLQHERNGLQHSQGQAMALQDEARQAEQAALRAVSLAMARADAAEAKQARLAEEHQRCLSKMQHLEAQLKTEVAQRTSLAAELQSAKTSMVRATFLSFSPPPRCSAAVEKIGLVDIYVTCDNSPFPLVQSSVHRASTTEQHQLQRELDAVRTKKSDLSLQLDVR